MTDEAYAFIDGAAFEATVEKRIIDTFSIGPEEIDWYRLTRGAQRIFYFDALPAKRKDETEKDYNERLELKKSRLDRLSRVPHMHVRTGVTRKGRRRSVEQKGVDILLAITVLSHAHLNTFRTARLFLNDMDFYPLLDELTRTRVKTQLFYNPETTSSDLLAYADECIPLTYYELSNATSNEVRLALGPSAVSYDISNDEPFRIGETQYGTVRIFRLSDGMYTLSGPMKDTTSHYHSSSPSQAYLVSHYEYCSQSVVTWKTSNQ